MNTEDINTVYNQNETLIADYNLKSAEYTDQMGHYVSIDIVLSRHTTLAILMARPSDLYGLICFYYVLQQFKS